MRLVSACILSSMFFGAACCFAQSRCPAAIIPGWGDKPVTSAEIAHRALATTPLENRHRLSFGDVEFILECGTQEDAETLFASVENKPVKMVSVTVVQANQDFVRVAWDDSFKPHLGAFVFNFNKPLAAVPAPGEKVILNGTYASYTRAPLNIVVTNSTCALLPPPVVIRPRSGQVVPSAPPPD